MRHRGSLRRIIAAGNPTASSFGLLSLSYFAVQFSGDFRGREPSDHLLSCDIIQSCTLMNNLLAII